MDLRRNQAFWAFLSRVSRYQTLQVRQGGVLGSSYGLALPAGPSVKTRDLSYLAEAPMNRASVCKNAAQSSGLQPP